MGASYYQFCPVAKAMELLDERWTMLIVRELLVGSRRFNELRRGLPRISPTLLSHRLQQLVSAGVLEKRVEGTDVQYVLTEAGEELRPAIEAIGAWGVRWIGELGDADLDPKLLMWDMRRRVDATTVPAGRSVLSFRFVDVPRRVRDWWLVLSDDEIDVCDTDPGFETAARITASLRQLVRVWLGEITWGDAVSAGGVTIDGPQPVRRAVPTWFLLSSFASVPRPNRATVG